MVLFQKLTRNLFLTLHGQKPTPSAVATVQVSHALPAVRSLVLTAAPSCKLTPRPRSKHEKQTVDSARETWTVAAADGVRFARVR